MKKPPQTNSTAARSVLDEVRPDVPQLAPAPEAIDLTVLKRLAEDPAVTGGVTTPEQVRRSVAAHPAG